MILGRIEAYLRVGPGPFFTFLLLAMTLNPFLIVMLLRHVISVVRQGNQSIK